MFRFIVHQEHTWRLLVTITRREFVATATAFTVAGRTTAQASTGKTIKAVGDIPSYDPVTSSSDPVQQHGSMIYDTLFGIDAQQNPQPQMVEKYVLSDDKRTWMFELRDGLRFHDGTEVTSADVVPSIRRWAARDGMGQAMTDYVKDITATDRKTFTIQLREPYGLLPFSLAKTAGLLCYVMRKKEAETDPNQKIDTVIGSGPFRFNQGETKPGIQYVYDKNTDYVPRNEPADGFSGGKVVKVDRIIYVNMPDPQTALGALQAGEIDFFGDAPDDILNQVAQDKNIKLQVINPLGSIGAIRLNSLQPPFDNAKCRQAMLHIVKQIDYLKANFSDPQFYRTCASYFACGGPMENSANTSWFETAPDYSKAKQLLKEGGYDGRPVVVLQPTNWTLGKTSAEILAAQMRRAGINVQMEPLEFGAAMSRRASKASPNQGGWNIFITTGNVGLVGVPVHLFHQANGERAWFGWPSDSKLEELRFRWAVADTLEERKRLAEQIQEEGWNYVPHVWFGQWVSPALMRANIKGMLSLPGVISPWWNVEKT